MKIVQDTMHSSITFREMKVGDTFYTSPYKRDTELYVRIDDYFLKHGAGEKLVNCFSLSNGYLVRLDDNKEVYPAIVEIVVKG